MDTCDISFRVLHDNCDQSGEEEKSLVAYDDCL